MKVKFKWEFPDFDKRFKSKIQKIYIAMAGQMQENRAELFYSEGKHNGRPGWAPLKFRKGQILQKSGALRRSMAPAGATGQPGPDGIVLFTGSKITIGTKLYYARMMNDGTTKMPGGILRPTKAKALKIPVGKNKFIFRKSVKIPARPFDDWNSTDEKEFNETLANLIKGALDGTL